MKIFNLRYVILHPFKSTLHCIVYLTQVIYTVFFYRNLNCQNDCNFIKETVYHIEYTFRNIFAFKCLSFSLTNDGKSRKHVPDAHDFLKFSYICMRHTQYEDICSRLKFFYPFTFRFIKMFSQRISITTIPLHSIHKIPTKKTI